MRYLEYRTPYELQREQASRLLKSNEDAIVPCQHGWHYDRSMYPSTVVQEVSYRSDQELRNHIYSLRSAVELGLRSQLLRHTRPGALWTGRTDWKLCFWVFGGSMGASSLLLCIPAAGDCCLCHECLRLELLLLVGTPLCCGSHRARHSGQSLCAGHRAGRTRATCLLHNCLQHCLLPGSGAAGGEPGERERSV